MMYSVKVDSLPEHLRELIEKSKDILPDTKEDASKLAEFKKQLSSSEASWLFSQQEVLKKLLEWSQRKTTIDEVISLLKQKIGSKYENI